MSYAQTVVLRLLPAVPFLLGLCLLASPARAGLASCPGDCNGNGEVTIDELITGVNIALGNAPVSNCPAFDRSGDGEVTIDDLIAAVNAALTGCPAGPTATATADAPTATATSGVPTATATVMPTTTPTGVPTGTAVATATATAIPTGTATATAIPTGTVTAVTPTATETPDGPETPTPTATPTSSPEPTETMIEPPAPADLTVVIDGDEVRLAWTHPDPGLGYPRALVMRRLNAPVTADDPLAEVVFEGEANTATHPLADLLPDVPEEPRTYHYAVFACPAEGDCGEQAARATLTPTLAEALRGGGYVIHWRHAAAPATCGVQDRVGSDVPEWWKSCFADCAMPDDVLARQLDADGRAESERIGAAVDLLGIGIGRVLSSEFCRNVQTAELMDLGPPIEQLPEITFFVYDESMRCANSYALLEEAPLAGTNTAIVGHGGFSTACPVLNDLAWAEAGIFKPHDGGTTFVTRVTEDEWATFLPPGPQALTASGDPFHVRLTWLNGPAYPSVVLLRRLNAPVSGPGDPDAELLFAGATNTLLDPLIGLLPNTPEEPAVYHYAVFGCVGPSCEPTGSATIFSRPAE